MQGQFVFHQRTGCSELAQKLCRGTMSSPERPTSVHPMMFYESRNQANLAISFAYHTFEHLNILNQIHTDVHTGRTCTRCMRSYVEWHSTCVRRHCLFIRSACCSCSWVGFVHFVYEAVCSQEVLLLFCYRAAIRSTQASRPSKSWPALSATSWK